MFAFITVSSVFLLMSNYFYCSLGSKLSWSASVIGSNCSKSTLFVRLCLNFFFRFNSSIFCTLRDNWEYTSEISVNILSFSTWPIILFLVFVSGACLNSLVYCVSALIGNESFLPKYVKINAVMVNSNMKEIVKSQGSKLASWSI